MSFEGLFNMVFQKMTPMHQIKKCFKGSTQQQQQAADCFLRKGKFQPVEFKLESRGGNKKVTTVHNLATFEIDFQQLQQRIRKELGCSVTLNELENSSAGSSMIQTNEHIVCVQGNQIYQIEEILKSSFLFIMIFFNFYFLFLIFHSFLFNK